MEDSIHENADIVVIVPVYNCEKFLEYAVMSVINQKTELKIDVVLIDDGSSDSSPTICDRLAKENSQVKVIHKSNGGVSSARNVAMDYISTHYDSLDKTYIAFLDADDAWVENFFDKDIIEVIKKRYDLIGFLTFSTNYDMSKRKLYSLMKEGEVAGGADSSQIHYDQEFTSMLYKASLIDKFNIVFDTTLKTAEDKIFRIECIYLADKIRLINKPIYLYRQNPASATHTRVHGIKYFSPMLLGHINLDERMLKWKNAERKELRYGRGFAKFYVDDMLDEHFAYGGTRKEAEQWFEEYGSIVGVDKSKLEKYTSALILKLRVKEFIHIIYRRTIKRLLTR